MQRRGTAMWVRKQMLEKLITMCVLGTALLSLSGCLSGGKNYGETVDIAVTHVFDGYNQNQEAFGYLHEALAENNNFTPKEKSILIKAEGALVSEFEYMSAITSVAGSVPYYEYKASFGRIKRNVKIMQEILDARIGEYPKATRIIYAMTRNNIAFIFHSMNTSIYQADKDISSSSTENMIQEFTQLYTAVKPLISTAALAL